MLELYLNTTTREWFDADGNPFSSRMPEMAYQSRETVRVYPKLTTPNAGEIGVNPSQWISDSTILNAEGIGALLTIDNDFTHKLKGNLSADVASGTVVSISAEIENATQAIIPSSGVVRLFNSQGEAEALRYNDRFFADGKINFTIIEGSSITGSYTTGGSLDVDQAPYCQCYFDPVQSNLTAGYFAFELVIDSPRLRESMDYANIDFLPIEGLEVLFYTLDSEGNQEPIKAFLLDTFSITGVIGNLGYIGEVPDAQRNEIAAVVGLLLSVGFDVDVRNNDGISEIRLKLASLGEDSWSGWVGVGFRLKAQYSVDGLQWNDNVVVGAKYIRTSVDGGETWSAAILIKGADGTDGEDGNPGAAAGFGEVTSSAEAVAFGTTPSVTITTSGEDTAKDFNFAFKIPEGKQGAKGDDGQSFTPNATGNTSEKAQYDAEAKGFAFLDTTEGLIYFKQSETSGDWSVGMPFGKGETGDAAGFGTPNATVTTLEPGNNATVSVTATGEDTAKVFTFAFGIPKGAKGDLPQKGVDYFTEEDKAELVASLEDVLLNGEWGTEAEATEAE